MNVADGIIAVLYGPGFPSAALRILSISLVPTFIYFVLGTMILVLNKERRTLVFWGFCATVNVALNAVLIPRYSYIGASVVIVISEFVLFPLFFFFFVSAEVGPRHSSPWFQKPLVTSIVVGLVLYVLRDVYLPLVAVAGVPIYVLLLVAMRTLTSDEVALVKQVVGRGTDTERRNDGFL
jgi:O-antigen/teichoic acid export membrane protein